MLGYPPQPSPGAHGMTHLGTETTVRGGHRACFPLHPNPLQMLSEKLFEQGAWAAPRLTGWHLGIKTAQPPGGCPHSATPSPVVENKAPFSKCPGKGLSGPGMGSGQGWGQGEEGCHFPEVQGHRRVRGPGRMLTLQDQIERVSGSEISRSNRAQAPGSQFGPTGS